MSRSATRAIWRCGRSRCCLCVVLAACALVFACALAGCADEASDSATDVTIDISYTKISADEAHDMMVSDRVVILDVRTQEEYDAGHIPNAQLLPVDEITELTAAEAVPDKEEVVLVYCRTGARSEAASRTLAELGYTNVYDFGGIVDWPYEKIATGGSDTEASASASAASSLPACAKLSFGMTGSDGGGE